MKYRIPANKVLIRPSEEHQGVITSNGNSLLIDTSYELNNHAVMSGVVVALPEHLLYSRDRHGEVDSVECDAEMELQIGDTVWFHHNLIENCVDNEEVIKDDSGYLVSGNYDMLYMAKRGEEIIPINGWCLVEPVSDEISNKILLPDNLIRQHSLKKGRVAYVGEPVREYRDETDFRDDEVKISAGDLIIFLPYSDIPIEYDLHASIDGRQRFYRMQRRDILAVIEE